MDPEEMESSIADALAKLRDETERSGSRTTKDPGTVTSRMADSDLACLRRKFTFLQDFSDDLSGQPPRKP